jgi:hypothetical protein
MDTQHINQKIVKQYVMLKVTLVTLSISQRSWIEHLPCVGWDKHVYGERLTRSKDIFPGNKGNFFYLYRIKVVNDIYDYNSVLFWLTGVDIFVLYIDSLSPYTCLSQPTHGRCSIQLLWDILKVNTTTNPL